MRRQIYTIIQPKAEDSLLSRVYDIFIIIVILLSMIPLMMKGQHAVGLFLERLTVTVFMIDYLLRWATADLYFEDKGYSSKLVFVKYPFTFMAIMDLLSILPAWHLLNGGFKTLRLLRLGRAFRVLRVFKSYRYSKNMELAFSVVRRQKDMLIAVAIFAAGYIFVAALLIFQIEPETFGNFFNALYWATISLTTIGYGDIVTTTFAGKLIAMASAFFGVSLVTMPAGIIAAGYLDEVRKREKNESDNTR